MSTNLFLVQPTAVVAFVNIYLGKKSGIYGMVGISIEVVRLQGKYGKSRMC